MPEAPRLPLPRRLLLAWAPPLAAGLIRTVWRTSSIEWIRRELMDELVEADRRFIYAFWHSRLFLIPSSYRGPGITGVISQHHDGELIARTMMRLGHETVRGSSTRGGSKALREALRACRRGRDIGITPDGPRGPVRQCKSGVIELARLTGCPILPGSLSYRRSIAARSWDWFELPLPFSRVVIACGRTLHCPREAGESERQSLAVELGRRLDALTNECRERLDQPPWPPVARPEPEASS